MNEDVHDQAGQRLKAVQQEHARNAFPEQLVRQILQVIERRADLVGAFHHLSDDQRAAEKVFDSVAAGMAVRQSVPQKPQLRRDHDHHLLIHVPPTATRAVVYSTGGVVVLDVAGQRKDEEAHLPIPYELRGLRIGRVEFYDAHGKLLLITAGEAPLAHQPYLAARL